MAETVTYAGRDIALDDLLNARAAIEEMAAAHKESMFRDDIHFAGHSTTMGAVHDLCTLASAMWYKLRNMEG